MLDRHLHPRIKPLLHQCVRVLDKPGITPDGLTLVGFAIGVLALPFLALGWYLAALVVILLNRLLDGLDGALARRRGLTDAGGFLDISLDFLFYALVPFGFILAAPQQNALAGGWLLFDTMAGVFGNMAGGRWWGALFFLFMVFAALSTVLGVCENILAMVRELTGWSRPKGCVVCGVGIFLLALTTALGYSVLHFQPFAPGSAWLDFWDFIVSNNVLPLGSLVLALFCCNRFGWGWDNFVAEANTGRGLKVRPWMKPIFKYFVPGAILFIYIYGMVTFHWR